jgi:stage V sporulation protein G
MEISEVRVKLVSNPDDRLKAFCSMTIDNEFVIRDIKVIEGAGGLFVAMPSRKMSDHCPRCGGKNYLRAKFCNTCGAKLPDNRIHPDSQGRTKLHADIAHPINAKCRRLIQETVLRAFDEEVERSKQPGYKPVSLDEDDYHSDESHH